MVRHNILITYRNFLRYKSSFFINLIGLSTGLACALLIFLWVNDELAVDQFHKNDERLYQVMENVEQGGGIITRYTTSGPTADAMASEMPEVEAAVTSTFERINDDVLSFDDRDVKARGLYASVGFFNLFSFELLHGQPSQVLTDKKSIVISEALAIRLFGTTENVVGKMVEWQHDKQFLVSGVMKNVPATASTQFDFILSFEGFRDENEWVTNWFNTAPQTHVLLKHGTDVEQFNKKIADLVRTKTEGKANHRTPFVRRYSDGYLYNRYENGVLAGGRIEYVRLFSIIAIFILLIACINFMNLSTARASRRLKEVGVKKAIGARQGTLIIQYLSESTVMAFVSLLVSLIIVVLLLPQFNIITGKNLTLSFNTTSVLALVGIVLVTGLVSGSYPALYLSKFNPAAVLKGKLTNFMGEIWARKGLVMFQFTLSIILIVSVWVVYEQVNFIQTKNLGYDKDNIVIITREGAVFEKQEAFLTEIEKIPGVIDASSTGHDMTGHNGGTYGIEWPGKDPEDRTEFERVTVNYGFVELMGMEMKEGRTFSEDFGAEKEKIIFNEAAIEFMEMKDPIGKVVKLWGGDREIIGVVKNFNFESFHVEVKPLFFFLEPKNTGNIMVKIENGKEQETMASLQKFYGEFNPGFPFTYRFLDEDYQNLYAAEQRVATLSKYFAGLAILISCLGLFGLAAFTAERRMKEIGIRKILGSTNINIIYLLSGEFTKMVLAAILVALPASYFIATFWLESFVFRIDLQWWFFAASGFAALFIAWLTVGIQTIRAAQANPTQYLRSE
ncbi:MAG: ABC transporter permease [Cyclobacteriaceae bacterium]